MKEKKVTLLLILFFIIFTDLSLRFNLLNFNMSNENLINDVYLKNSDFWDLTGSNIFIDDLNPTKSWNYLASQYDWISGSGTWNDPYLIENVTINGLGTGSCIYITNSYVPFIIRNSTLYNSGSGSLDAGIRLETVENGRLVNNNVSFNNYYGIELIWDSINNTIINNTISSNKQDGIFLSNGCNNNIILNNTITHNERYGIYLYYLNNYNRIINNSIYYNIMVGIALYVSGYNIISDNNVGYSDYGVSLSRDCNYNNITNNVVRNNFNGILLLIGGSSNSHHNLIENNTVKDNSNMGIYLGVNVVGPAEVYQNTVVRNRVIHNNFGIYLRSADQNLIIENNITNNIVYGVRFWGGSNLNLFYKNNFIVNPIHVSDPNGGNIWDNGFIGNYWDDYVGFDRNDDGIGDSPYIKSNVQDNYPIWEDGDDIPIITINKPLNGTFFRIFPPNYDVIISAADLHSSWYSLNEGKNYTFTSTSGIINQSAWDLCDNGTVRIEFFVNDTAGNSGYDEVYVYKDVYSANLSIISPIPNQLFSYNTIDFDILIEESNLNLTWYTLNGGSNYYFKGTSGTINFTAWESCGNGSLIIRFYANDSAGNIGLSEVIIRKDIEKPNITIIAPTPFQLFGNNTFNFELTIDEGNLNSTWYTLDNGLNNYTFLGTSGIIDQDAWNACDNGTVTIRFFANDSVENIAFKEIIVRKDKINPIINIIKPEPINIFGNSTFSYEIQIQEANLHSIWYSFDNGTTNYVINQPTGIINQEFWDAVGNGTVNLIFYANDSVGNNGSSKVIIRKNIYAPNIIFEFSEVYLNTTTPEYYHNGLEVSCEIINYTSLLWVFLSENSSGIMENRSMSYLGNGRWTYTVDITSLEWKDQFDFYFLTKDILGYTSINNNYSNMYIIEIHDFQAPIINIISPSMNQLHGINAPTFQIDINELNLQEKWYSFNGRPNITFTTETQFDQTEWDKLSNGTVLITFYAKDEVGNMNFTEVIVRKDANEPDIIIFSPILGETFGNTPLTFNISIIEEDLVSTWYTVQGSLTQYFFTGLTGLINQNAWNNALEGDVIITFYAQDRAGNIGIESVIVKKIPPTQTSISGYDLLLLIGAISVISMIILAIQKKKIFF